MARTNSNIPNERVHTTQYDQRGTPLQHKKINSIPAWSGGISQVHPAEVVSVASVKCMPRKSSSHKPWVTSNRREGQRVFSPVQHKNYWVTSRSADSGIAMHRVQRCAGVECGVLSCRGDGWCGAMFLRPEAQPRARCSKRTNQTTQTSQSCVPGRLERIR